MQMLIIRFSTLMCSGRSSKVGSAPHVPQLRFCVPIGSLRLRLRSISATIIPVIHELSLMFFLGASSATEVLRLVPLRSTADDDSFAGADLRLAACKLQIDATSLALRF